MRLILPRDGEDGRDRYQVAPPASPSGTPTACSSSTTRRRFYLYRMLFTDEHGRSRRTHGVIGALGLPPPTDPATVGVLPHERTLPKAKSDRLALLRATR